MDRVVLILGAGASIEYFDPPLTTASLTATVCDQSRWTSLLGRYHAIAQGANTIEPQALSDLLTWLRGRGPSLNFEDYAEVIDKVASYSFDSVGGKVLHTAIRFLGGTLNHYPMHTWTAVPFLLRQMISERIQEKHDSERSSNYDHQIQDLGAFLKHLFDSVDLSVVSFNYDEILREALQTAGVVLEDGFNSDYFKSADYLNGHSILAYPHGHARFVLDDHGLRQFPTMAEANKSRLENLYGAGRNETRYLLSGPNSYNFNTFLTSGRDKDNSFNGNPYAAYYQRLAYDLLQARVVIVAGFSLQDAHICRLLINFRKNRTDNTILVVDYEPRDVDMFKSFTSPCSLIAQLLDTVDVHGIPMSGNFTSQRYALQAGVNELNSTGAGEIFPQIKMCKVGLSGFLSDFKSILRRTCSL